MHGLSPALPASMPRNLLLSDVFSFTDLSRVSHTGDGWNVKYLALNAVVHHPDDGAVYHILNYLIYGLYMWSRVKNNDYYSSTFREQSGAPRDENAIKI